MNHFAHSESVPSPLYGLAVMSYFPIFHMKSPLMSDCKKWFHCIFTLVYKVMLIIKTVLYEISKLYKLIIQLFGIYRLVILCFYVHNFIFIVLYNYIFIIYYKILFVLPITNFNWILFSINFTYRAPVSFHLIYIITLFMHIYILIIYYYLICNCYFM